MNFDLHKSWKPHLELEFEKPYFKELSHFVNREYETHICYPQKHEIFNAFNHCHFNDLKVVIIGQDPYHGPNQANGLCFSVHDGIVHPPSLRNIFKELETDLGIPYPSNGNLIPWSKQGVLLLNATLTVRENAPGSHQKKGWETFTDAVIRCISSQKENIVFLLWGGYAKNKAHLIDRTKHHLLMSGHPSPLSANRGYWYGNSHFSNTNLLLQQNAVETIDWSLNYVEF